MMTLTKAYHYAHASDEIRQSTLFSLKYHGGIILFFGGGGGLSEIHVSIIGIFTIICQQSNKSCTFNFCLLKS